MLCRGGSTPPSISYRTSASDTTAGSYTFSAQDIGTAGSNRHVIVGILGTSADGDPVTIGACTIGGVAATVAISQAGNANGHTANLIIAAVPTGATANIVVVANGPWANCAIGVWAAYDLTSITAVATAGSTADPTTLNLNTQSGDIVVAVMRATNGTATTWTGVTERFDTTVETMLYTGGEHTATSTETPRTVSGDSDGTGQTGVSASWR